MLNLKQQRFVDEFAIDHNASRAARAAGYGVASAKVTASRLLTNANVLAAVRDKELAAESTLQMTREKVLAALQESFEKARLQSEPAAMIAACRVIAQMCGYFSPNREKVDLTFVGNSNQFDVMTDAELIAVIQGGGV